MRRRQTLMPKQKPPAIFVEWQAATQNYVDVKNRTWGHSNRHAPEPAGPGWQFVMIQGLSPAHLRSH